LQFTKAISHRRSSRTTTVISNRCKEVFKGLVTSTASVGTEAASVLCCTPQIRSLATPAIVDFVSADDNNLITTLYLTLVLIFVPTRDAQNRYFTIRISVYQMLNYPDKYLDTNMASFPVK